MRSMTPRSVFAVSVVLLAAGAASAGVRVIHASPDTPNVDVYADVAPGPVNPTGAPAFSNLPFRSATAYAPLPTNNYRFRVTPAGVTTPVAIDATASINAGTDCTIAAIGLLGGSPAISPLVLVDDNTLNPAAARVRFVHASPDAPAVNIVAVGVGNLFTNVTFGTSGGYVTVPQGSYDLEVRLTSNNALALSVPGVFVGRNQVYSIFAVGQVGNGSLAAQPFVDAIPAPGAAGVLALAGLAAARRRR
jgi:Domain of unknown function (DUF4397)